MLGNERWCTLEESKLTASVQVSHFLAQKPLGNMGEPFRLLSRSTQVLLEGARWRSRTSDLANLPRYKFLLCTLEESNLRPCECESHALTN